MMKGTISVKSVLGEGSEFTVDLDLESMEEETLEVREEEDSVRAEILYSLEMNSVKTSDSRVVIEARSKQVRGEDRDGE